MKQAIKDAPIPRIRIEDIAEGLRRGESCKIGGLWGSSYLYILGALRRQINPAVWLLVLPGIEEAESAYEDITSFLPQGQANLYLFPAWETRPEETTSPDTGILKQRLKTLTALKEKQAKDLVIITFIQALLQDVPEPELLSRSYLRLKTGGKISLEKITGYLVDAEFERVPQIEFPGEFSIRGGIIDIYPYEYENPVRIELLGDTIESIREFDVSSQVSQNKLNTIRITLIRKSDMFSARTPTHSLIDYLPACHNETAGRSGNSFIALKEPEEIASRAERYLGRITGDQSLRPPVRNNFTALYNEIQQYPNISFYTLPVADEDRAYNFRINSLQRFSSGLANMLAELESLANANQRIIIFCTNPAERERLKELFAGTSLENNRAVELRIGHLTTGFQFLDTNTVFISHHELFNRYRQPRRPKYFKGTRPIDSFLELAKDDFVVHTVHGIGRYRGIEKLIKDGRTQEFLTIEYQDRARVYVPTSQIELVQKYIGGTNRPPVLSKLGTALWENRKERVKEVVARLAQDLLEIQAIREKESGIAYLPDSRLPADEANWQDEFEASFPYEDTPDQINITQTIKKDMESRRPMDRLICGDVGYGKTELAMRAAFKAAIFGKQVAVLVPTTILAQQHFLNFTERMADYPINIGLLSRFKSRAEQAKTIAQLKQDEVDIIIGTHRLLQSDIGFKDLGLIVIDEEQRFGVEHKERLKRLRAIVDILTLTATPIPRTLHMALLGIRDISTLSTPPQDRRAIQTCVMRFDKKVIREAILRELNRDGQIYFVHNQIYDIEAIAETLRKLVPEATLAIAHGQLDEDILEQRMEEFIKGKIDILVSTNIIESGLDIPKANTLFVNNADRFGLADLHQLRGRVGRYKHQAFAYFLLPQDRAIIPEATKRLKAIQEFNELGAGFKIALRDMEIRGVGNILGREQHGQIAAVGYDLYCRLLETAVKRVKNEPIRTESETSINLKIDAFLPAGYISSEKQRIDLYRKIARAGEEAEVESIRDELKDRFGPLPNEVENFMELARLRILAQQYDISELTQVAWDNPEVSPQTRLRRVDDRIIAVYRDKSKAQRLRDNNKKLIRIIDEKTLYINIPDKVLTKSEQSPEATLKSLYRPASGGILKWLKRIFRP